MRPEDLPGAVLISSDLGRHAEWLNELAELGRYGHRWFRVRRPGQRVAP